MHRLKRVRSTLKNSLPRRGKESRCLSTALEKGSLAVKQLKGSEAWLHLEGMFMPGDRKCKVNDLPWQEGGPKGGGRNRMPERRFLAFLCLEGFLSPLEARYWPEKFSHCSRKA